MRQQSDQTPAGKVSGDQVVGKLGDAQARKDSFALDFLIITGKGRLTGHELLLIGKVPRPDASVVSVDQRG
ncbi:hypothetical protein D3C75_1331140 [compost metagenome]